MVGRNYSYLPIICWSMIIVFLIHSVKSDGNDDRSLTDAYNYTVAVVGPLMNCSGSIVGPKHVITSAHCVLDDDYKLPNNSLRILPGIEDQFLDIAKVCIHKSYGPHPALKYHYADLAVLELLEPIGIGSFVTLPSESDYEKVEVLWLSTIYQKYYDDNYVKNLMSTKNVTILDANSCTKAWPVVAQHIDFDKQFCVRFSLFKDDDCTSNAGGPLVNPMHEDKNIILGMLSISPDNCDESSSSGIYTRITYYRNFIENIINGVNDENAKCQEVTF